MATKEELKQRICESVDRRSSQIEGIGDHIMANPELGFKEFETARLVASTFEEFGFSPETGFARTGVKAVLKGKKPGPTVALIGELDSLGVSDHPKVCPETGAAHACGHNAQIAGLLGDGYATVEIETLPGYLPLENDPGLIDVFESNSKSLFSNETFTRMDHRASSTDMGDVSHLLPSIHPYMAGGSGSHHSKDWHIADKEMGYLGPAKSLATMVVDLLYDDAAKAKEVVENHKPLMTKEAYLAFQEEILRKETYDGEAGTSA